MVASRAGHETSIQELRATNEELQSINEEYRSTAEELETSKEELQSINEELHTVNAELKSKLASISVAHSDLQNLTDTTEIGTLFLDSDLRIKMFTPPITDLFTITKADVGRMLTDFSHRLSSDGIDDDSRQVLRQLAPIEREVHSREGRAYVMRMRPYRTIEDRIDGVVVTFFDITDRQKAQAALRENESKYRALFESIEEGFTIVETVRDDDGRLVDLIYREANSAYANQAGFQPRPGQRLKEVMPDVENNWMAFYDRVSTSGVPEKQESFNSDLNRWFRTQASRIGPAGSPLLGIVFEDVTTRKVAEIALRESEERQAFLLELSDDFARLSDPDEIMQVMAARTGEHMGLGTCAFADVDDGRQLITVHRGWNAGGERHQKQTFRTADFLSEELQHAARAGEPLIIRDVATDPRADAEACARVDVGSFVIIPFHRNGRWTALFAATDSKARDWTPAEILLFREICDRVFPRIERARVEIFLRESEERFRCFAEASASGLWIRDAATLEMEFVNRTVGEIYGVPPDAVLGPLEKWAALIVPDDRDTALAHIDEARQGRSVVHEFRIQRPSDQMFRWIRNTDFPLHVDGHIQRIGGIAEDVTETKRLVEHQGVLVAELQHRVRNIMGMFRSMARRTADGAQSVESYRDLLEGRLMALARVQALLTRSTNSGGSLRGILETEIRARAHGDNELDLTGPEILLSPKAVEVMTLAFHELSTNAAKYGALSAPGGKLTVTWAPFEKRGSPWLGIDWIEEGAPPPKPLARRGFGSELIEARIPYELGGTGKMMIGPEGARCRMEFPLREAESILETDSPTPTTIFGGALDMSGAPDLGGQRVLVVENDYYAAADTAGALRGAGAEVVGPCQNEDAVLNILETDTPSVAVIDLNLRGGGPRFDIARALRQRGIPFILLTGYDAEVIPPDLSDVPRLQKPVTPRDIVNAVSLLSETV